MIIIHVLNFFPPAQIAGTEIYTLKLVKHQIELGHTVTVLIPNFDSNICESYSYQGIEVYKYAEPTKVDRLIMAGGKKTDGIVHFEKYLKYKKPNIIHFHEVGTSNGININHFVIAKQLDAKLVFTFHVANYTCKTGTLYYKNIIPCDGTYNVYKCSSCYINNFTSGIVPKLLPFFSNLLYKANCNTYTWGNKVGTALGTNFVVEKNFLLTKAIFELIDKGVVISNWYKKVLIANNFDPDKIEIIKQDFDTNNLNIGFNDTNSDNSILKLVFLGRLSPIKGLDFLLEAVIQLPPDKVSLHIYGQSTDFYYEQELKRKTKDSKNIHWCGLLPQEDVINTLKNFDILCLCSTVCEMNPLVIDDAFAAGIPVLASNVLGNAEKIIHGQNGILYDFNNEQSLNNHLLSCIENPEITYAMKKLIFPPIGFQQVSYAYLRLYNGLI